MGQKIKKAKINLKGRLPLNIEKEAIETGKCAICGWQLIYNTGTNSSEIICSNDMCRHIYYEDF